jgi:hypothetical protein
LLKSKRKKLLKTCPNILRELWNNYSMFKTCYKPGARCQWFTPVILATQEAEIRRIAVQSQPRQIVCKNLP